MVVGIRSSACHRRTAKEEEESIEEEEEGNLSLSSCFLGAGGFWGALLSWFGVLRKRIG
jgi:hypothetical protein